MDDSIAGFYAISVDLPAMTPLGSRDFMSVLFNFHFDEKYKFFMYYVF